MQIDRFDSIICSCCARRAVGIAYAPSKDHKPIWVCDDPACLEAAQNTYTMQQQQFDAIEQQAVVHAGRRAGQYLDKLDRTDLSTLSTLEFQTFCRELIAGYRVALATTLRNEAPF